MRKLRILVLTHEDLLPPEDAARPEGKYVKWKTEFDVLTGLAELGHDARILGAETDLTPIREAIKEQEPHIVFNLLESFHGVPSYDHYVTSYLELLRRPYTGCNSRGLLLSRDKGLCRKILSYHRIPGPGFAVFPRKARVRKPARVEFPLLVKSLMSDGSIGLAQASIVDSAEKLEKRVVYLQETFDTDVIAEEYIPGREISMPIIGNRRLEHFPLMELKFGNLAPGTEPIATSKVKWDWKYQKDRSIELVTADCDPELERRIVHIGKRVYRALGLSGYARIDYRVTESGKVYVIEANPNADLSHGEEFHESVEVAGVSYAALLQRILSLGLRYQAEWRQVL